MLCGGQKTKKPALMLCFWLARKPAIGQARAMHPTKQGRALGAFGERKRRDTTLLHPGFCKRGLGDRSHRAKIAQRERTGFDNGVSTPARTTPIGQILTDCLAHAARKSFSAARASPARFQPGLLKNKRRRVSLVGNRCGAYCLCRRLLGSL